MGTVVTVMNMKGGVGKTTTAMHLGGMCSIYRLNAPKRRKVLMIDYDPQFNLSQAWLPAKQYFALESARKTILAVLLDDDATLDPYHLQVPGNELPPKVADITSTLHSYRDGGTLDLVPSTLDLMYVALGQASSQIMPIEERFRKFIEECRTLYDIVLIDCHPAGSLFTKTSLRNSDHVLIPVVPQRYAVRGIGLMLDFIASKKQGATGPMPHILFNSTPRTGTTQEERDIRGNKKFAAYCMNTTLKYYRAFSDPEEGRHFVWASGKPWSTNAFQNLMAVTAEFIQRIGA